ncbi:MAG TPA: hypothetical protein VET66_06730 [Steroidobacteraceae bacterium]|jgi:hypothetical protein|nr:hypothetical protein [Steroidobacteraceae bacterium]
MAAPGNDATTVGERARAFLRGIAKEHPNPSLQLAAEHALRGNQLELHDFVRSGRKLRVAMILGAAELRAAEVYHHQLSQLPAVAGPQVPTGF